MDCRFDRQTLRYVKWHDGEQEQTILDHFDDPRTRKRLHNLRTEKCLRQNDIFSVPVGVKGEPVSLIGRQWFITDKGRGCLRSSLLGDLQIISIVCVIVFGIVNILIAISH